MLKPVRMSIAATGVETQLFPAPVAKSALEAAGIECMTSADWCYQMVN